MDIKTTDGWPDRVKMATDNEDAKGKAQPRYTCPCELRRGTVCNAPVAEEGDYCSDCIEDAARLLAVDAAIRDWQEERHTFRTPEMPSPHIVNRSEP